MSPPTAAKAAAAEVARRLAHDVGKYISRAARNLHELPPPQALLELLLDDLYALNGNVKASHLFEDRVTALEAMIGVHPALMKCREQLCRIDALEPAIRAGDSNAIQEAARAAISVDETLRALAGSLSERSAP